jgi:hypothetical protein
MARKMIFNQKIKMFEIMVSFWCVGLSFFENFFFAQNVIEWHEK